MTMLRNYNIDKVDQMHTALERMVAYVPFMTESDQKILSDALKVYEEISWE